MAAAIHGFLNWGGTSRIPAGGHSSEISSPGFARKPEVIRPSNTLCEKGYQELYTLGIKVTEN